MILTGEVVPRDEFAQATGWTVKPEGACQGDVCVPLPPGALEDDNVRVAPVAERLGMPLLADEERHLWSLGPAALGGRALRTAEAAPLRLPDLDGSPFPLGSLHGQKVLLVAWASW